MEVVVWLPGALWLVVELSTQPHFSHFFFQRIVFPFCSMITAPVNAASDEAVAAMVASAKAAA